MKGPKLYIKIIINFLIFVVVTWLIFSLLPKVLVFFMPFVIGWIVALISNPLVKFLERKIKLLRKHSSAIIIVFVIGLVVGLAYFLIGIMIREVKQLNEDLPFIIEQLGTYLDALSKRIRIASDNLPENISDVVDEVTISIGQNINNYFSNFSPPSLDTAGSLARNIADIFTMVIITILSAYFFIVSRDELIDNFKKHIPSSVIDYYNLVFDNFKSAVGGYFKAQFKIMFIIAGIMFIGFEILGVGYSFLLALGIAFVDFLPVFGTGAILWPWALFNVVFGNYPRAVGLMIIYLICQILKQVIQPKMVGDSIGISPLSTLVFMFIGYRLYSVIGLILGIPIDGSSEFI